MARACVQSKARRRVECPLSGLMLNVCVLSGSPSAVALPLQPSPNALFLLVFVLPPPVPKRRCLEHPRMRNRPPTFRCASVAVRLSSCALPDSPARDLGAPTPLSASARVPRVCDWAPVCTCFPAKPSSSVHIKKLQQVVSCCHLRAHVFFVELAATAGRLVHVDKCSRRGRMVATP